VQRQVMIIASAALATLVSAPSLLAQAVPTFARAVPDGAALYQAKCGGCHSLATNRIGPAHKGVYGRKAGMAPGYRYSVQLKASAITWTDKTLDRWLRDPQQVVRGSKMFLSLPDAAERKAIIAYLKSSAAR
jgi:cytochrome c